MVNIPTSRDIGFSSPRSGRIAPSGPSVSVGAALSNLGTGIQQAAYNLNDLAASEQVDRQRKTGYDVETKLTEFRSAEEQRFNEAQQKSSESGIGFTRQFIEGYQKRANDFIKQNFDGLSEAQNAQGRQSLLGLGNSLYSKSYDYEQKAKSAFYDRSTNQNLDTVRTSIRNNAAPYDELKRQGLAAIDAADMPEPWKAERRALWDADAAESKWQWKYEQDPKAAIQTIRGSGDPVKKAKLSSSVQDRGSYAMNFYMNKGYTREQAAGIVGNLVQESGIQPTGAVGDNGTAFGIAQWRGERFSELKRFAASQGKSWEDLDTQLAFVDIELQNRENSAGQRLRAAKTVDEATAAFIGFERPQGWTEANPRGGHGYSSRLSNAAAFVDGDVSTDWTPDPDVEKIPYDRRQQLAAWGETQYSQQQNQQRAAAKDSYNLMIATEPQNVRQDVILNDPALDNGDKATLINSLNAANKENAGVNELLSGLSQGNVSVNSYDPDQRKVADKAFEKIAAAAGPENQGAMAKDFVDRTGYIPKPVQQELRKGASSSDPRTVAVSMKTANVLHQSAPSAFTFEGAEDVQKKMDLYNSYTKTMGYSPDEAAQRIIDASNPEKVRQREALIKSEPVKKAIKAIDAGVISAGFDDSFMGFSSNPSLGPNPSAEAAMVAEYKSIYEESVVDANGDLDVAKEAAEKRFHRIYGVSEFSTLGNTVVRYPVEKTYPAGADGTHEWVRKQAIEALKSEGVTSDEIYLMPMPNGVTEKDALAGKPARYQVLYKDPETGTVEQFNLPFYADQAIEKQRETEKLQMEIQQSEQDMLRNRQDYRPGGFRTSVQSQATKPPSMTETFTPPEDPGLAAASAGAPSVTDFFGGMIKKVPPRRTRGGK
jgi:hypothetical protein